MLKIENNYLRDKTKETLNNKLVNQKRGECLLVEVGGNAYKRVTLVKSI